MRFVIVTGMSGAGKSTALNRLEDMGYFCVDNLPISLISKFAEMAYTPGSEIQRVALGVDVRSGEALGKLEDVLEGMAAASQKYEILFLDAADEVLVKRYKETRRTHPLARGGRVDRGIAQEREKLAFLKRHADYIIYNSTIDGELSSIDELLAKSNLLADFKAVKDGNVWCTGKNLFQETTELGTMIEDIHTILTTDDDSLDELVYMHKLK